MDLSHLALFFNFSLIIHVFSSKIYGANSVRSVRIRVLRGTGAFFNPGLARKLQFLPEFWFDILRALDLGYLFVLGISPFNWFAQ